MSLQPMICATCRGEVRWEGMSLVHVLPNRQPTDHPAILRGSSDALAEAAARDDGGSSVWQPEPDNLYPSATAYRICEKIMPEWQAMFIEKSRDYRDGHESLGAAGQFADIWRKIIKLKVGMWDGEPLVGEPLRVILMDLMSHCALAIDSIDNDNMRGTL